MTSHEKYIPQSAALRFDFPALKLAKYNNANKAGIYLRFVTYRDNRRFHFNQITIEERYSGEKEILAVFGSTGHSCLASFFCNEIINAQDIHPFIRARN
ncbi:hypothetical protein MJ569_10740 [Escherichia coli]|nr:hypothetical protein MJ569_10740 [Escherichia coli]